MECGAVGNRGTESNVQQETYTQKVSPALFIIAKLGGNPSALFGWGEWYSHTIEYCITVK